MSEESSRNSGSTSQDEDWLINDVWKVRKAKTLGLGSFGEVVSAVNIVTKEVAAIKLEESNVNRPKLQIEADILKNLQGGTGIPKFYYYGQYKGYNCLVMELLGPSLEQLLNLYDRSLSLDTVLFLSEQLILRMEYIHAHNYVHRDIKPNNFLIGLGNKDSTVYVIDYGLSRKYIDPKTGQHIPFKAKKGLVGTMRYASINAHYGSELSRRDDLESLGYVIIYLFLGHLPWEKIKMPSKKLKYKKVKEMKEKMSVDELCKNCPREFADYLKYVKSLGLLLLL